MLQANEVMVKLYNKIYNFKNNKKKEKREVNKLFYFKFIKRL